MTLVHEWFLGISVWRSCWRAPLGTAIHYDCADPTPVNLPVTCFRCISERRNRMVAGYSLQRMTRSHE